LILDTVKLDRVIFCAAMVDPERVEYPMALVVMDDPERVE